MKKLIVNSFIVICIAFVLMACKCNTVYGADGQTADNSNQETDQKTDQETDQKLDQNNQDEVVSLNAADMFLSDEEITLYAGGDTQELKAIVIANNSTDKKEIIWSSSDDSVATVKDGVVTPMKEGTVSISASYEDVSAICTVTVLAQNKEINSIASSQSSSEAYVESDNYVYNNQIVNNNSYLSVQFNTIRGNVKVSNDTNNSYLFSGRVYPYKKDAYIHLSAEANKNYKFSCWVDAETQTILSISADYECYIGSGDDLIAIFLPKNWNTVSYVSKRGDNIRNVLAVCWVHNGTKISTPTLNPPKGYKIKDNLYIKHPINEDHVLTVCFQRDDKLGSFKFKVTGGTFSNGCTSGEFLWDQQITVSADPNNINNFCYWTINKKIVSTKSTYSFFYSFQENKYGEIVAVYKNSDNNIAKVNSPFTLLWEPIYDEEYGLSIYCVNKELLVVDNNYTIIETGIAFSYFDSNFTIDDNFVIHCKVNNNYTDQFYIRKYIGCYAKAYIIYKDNKTGSIYTVYSSVQ